MEENKENPISVDLTPKQELFCRYYTQNTALFGNATLAYAEAYDYSLDELSQERPVLETDEEGNAIKYGVSDYDKAYNVCSVQGSKTLRIPKIQERLVKLLNEYMKDEVVDAQLMKVIISGEDKDKVAAIKEYNKLRQRIVDKFDHTSGGKPIFIPSELADKNGINTSTETNS